MIRELGIATLLLAPFATSRARAQSEPGEEERWSSFLPLMGDEARARGYELPLPFGVAFPVFLLRNRDIEVTDLRIGVGSQKPTSVSKFVDFGSSSDVENVNVKLDAFLLPFLDVYALAGYVHNVSITKGHVSVPKPGPIPGTNDFDFRIESELDGFVGGGGLTLAGGFENLFMVLDANWSQTDIGFDNRFRAIIASMRAGWQGKLGDTATQMWIGGSYWDTFNTASGHTDVPGLGTIHFEADQGPKFPWFLDVGANVRVAKHLDFFLDVGTDLHGGSMMAIGPTLRF